MTEFRFAKSSYSSGNGECVEVARNIPRAVAVRDSKRPAGPVLTVTPAAWDAFTADVRRQP
ncbi:DUF397 domain-containing protein [Streptomyces sp. TE33382]